MKRVSDREIVETISGTFASSSADEHGDRIVEEMIEEMKLQFEQNPDKRYFTYQHTNRVIGEVLEVDVEYEEDEVKLVGEVGIYEGNDDVIEEIKSGELSAFSIEGHYYRNIDEEDWTDDLPKLEVAVDARSRGPIAQEFEDAGLQFKGEIKKEVTTVTLITLIVENIHKIALAIVILHGYFFGRDQGEDEEASRKVELPNGEEISVDEEDLEKVLEELEETLGEEIAVDYETLSAEEIQTALEEIINS